MRQLALPLLLAGCAATPGGTCAPRELTEIPLLRVGHAEVVPVEIDGEPAGLMLDTGAYGTSITPQAVTALGLHDSRVYLGQTGIGGEKNNGGVEISSIKIGAQTVHDALAMDIPISRVPLDRFPVYGLLGEDIMVNYDLDLDAAHDDLTLYAPAACAAPAPPWSATAQTVELEVRNEKLQNVLPVTLDGHDVSALLDTGAGASLVNEAAAGLDAAAVAADPVRHAYGINLMPVTTRVHHFTDLTVAGRSYGPADLPVTANLLPGFDMLLGEDFLHRHRVFIAAQAHKLLIAPAGP